MLMLLVETATPERVRALKKILNSQTERGDETLHVREQYVFAEGVRYDDWSHLRRLLESHGFTVWLITQSRKYGERVVYNKKKGKQETGRRLYDRLIQSE